MGLLTRIVQLPLLRNNPKSYSCIKNFYCTAKMKEQQTTVNGQTINYVKTGSGDHAVLCFPGALGTIFSDFKPQVEGLDKSKFTVVAWDPPGYGHSRPPDRKFGTKFYEDDADCAYDFMMALGMRKFSLLGWSDGGISSMILSAKRPASVERLVIWGANSYIVPKEVEQYEKIRDISNWSERMKAPLIKLYTEKGLQKMWNDWCDAIQQIYSEGGGDICDGMLKDIQCPTFILHGDKDPMIAPEHPGHLHSNIKGSRLHRFPDGKHNIHLKYAEEFNRIVSEFLLSKGLKL